MVYQKGGEAGKGVCAELEQEGPGSGVIATRARATMVLALPALFMITPSHLP